MEIAVDRTGGELPDLPDMRAKQFPTSLLRQPLRYSDDGYQNSRRHDGRDYENIGPE